MTATTRAPDLTVEGRGTRGDVPVITLDLETGDTARDMTRRITRALSLARAGHWVHIIGREPAGTRAHEDYLDKALAVIRPYSAFTLELDLETAYELRERLDAAIGDAETECRWDPCTAIGTMGGVCPAHYDRMGGVSA